MDAVPIVPPLFRGTKNTTLHELQTGDKSRATDTRKSAGLNRPAVEAILCNSPLQQPRALPPEDRREGAGFMAAW